MTLPDFDRNDYNVLRAHIAQLPPDQQELLNAAVKNLSDHLRNIGYVNALFLVYYMGRFMKKKELETRNAFTKTNRR